MKYWSAHQVIPRPLVNSGKECQGWGDCGGGCRQGMHLGEPLLSSLMCVLLGSSHIISAFLHCPLEGSDLYGRANPRVDAIELLTVSPGVLVRHAWGEKHTLSRTDYHYGILVYNIVPVGTLLQW